MSTIAESNFCETCGAVGPDIEYLPDPYAYELYGEVTMGYWCDNCYTERSNDI
jgi:hypothetical protein